MKMTRWQWLGLIAAGLIPGVWLILGLILWLLGASVPTFSYVFTYLLLPATVLVLLWRIVRKGWNPGWRAFACIALLIGAVWLTTKCMAVGHFSIYDHAEGEDGLAMYERDIGASNPLLPEVVDLGAPEQIEYHYFYNQWVTFFRSDCYTLICTYSPEDYAAMTGALESQYVFHSAPLYAGETTLEPLYELDGYRFRFLQMDGEAYDLRFPKDMVLVGTNDETREIVWSYYYDDDLDSIDKPKDFLLEDCGWKYIR